MRHVELKLEFHQGVSGTEAFLYFKKLEKFIKDNFVNVTNFNCEKPLHKNYAVITFYHDGPKDKKLPDNEFKQLLDEKSI